MKKKTIKSEQGIELPKKDKCDRCGNDLSMGAFYIHLPYIKMYIILCGICNKGLQFGFYTDFLLEVNKLRF